MNQQQMENRIVLTRFKDGFIDAHTPGSNQKENFTIIGGGVSESADQHVHITETPGFNIGAAGQPPKCVNSLHYHNSAEVFFILRGKWRFFWGLNGDAGEVILQEGDLISVPTRIFRGFENVGTDYGMIMAILGGDDAGGGVIWAPQVIEDATNHGLILAETGCLYDTKKGESLPDKIRPMPVLSAQELTTFPELTTRDLVPNHVARYWDLISLSDTQPVKVIGDTGLLVDRPGFEVDFLTRRSITSDLYSTEQHEILMPMRGHWKLQWDNGESVLNPGDTAAIPPNIRHAIYPAMTGEISLYRVRNTSDPAGSTWK